MGNLKAHAASRTARFATHMCIWIQNVLKSTRLAEFCFYLPGIMNNILP